jgi:hypothetical protein
MFALEVLGIYTAEHQFSSICFFTLVSIQPEREYRFIHKLLIQHIVPEKNSKRSSILETMNGKVNQLANLDTSTLENTAVA